MFDPFQFYPTPLTLARKCWDKFKNQDFVRILEPSAGTGSLITALSGWNEGYYRHWNRPQVDAFEIDFTKHAILRENGIDVIGFDFLAATQGAIYSHVLMNPPFADGVHHVLKAWELVWEAEIVAILNAETIRNPFSKERQRLVSLIEQFGEVEFISDAFKGEEVEREADVEIALVYLKKEADIENDIFGDLLADLEEDREHGAGLAGDYQEMHEVSIPRTLIETQVACFDAAVVAMRQAVIAEAKANHYSALLGETMAERQDEKKPIRRNTSANFVRKELGARYVTLKDQAWASILRSSNVTAKLSSKAQKRVEAEFDSIKKLSFTVQNIYGFLTGIVESQGQIQLDMACDVFDAITRYHSDNTCYYKGWKSNDKHRTCGMKIKATRFVIPNNRVCGSQLDWNSMQMLRDFDKVFAMLDAKPAPDVSLEYVFSRQLDALRQGERVSSSYFDVRYYPGVQTIHFFPRDKKMMDKLNRMVGRQRQWIPPETTSMSENFWEQFDKAEKFTKEVEQAVKAAGRVSYGRSPFWALGREDEDGEYANRIVGEALNTVLEKHGISTEFLLESKPQRPEDGPANKPRLLLAA